VHDQVEHAGCSFGPGGVRLDPPEEADRWEFFFAALPWRMVGVTSSASNPVAVF
jgi:hypothetical protein